MLGLVGHLYVKGFKLLAGSSKIMLFTVRTHGLSLILLNLLSSLVLIVVHSDISIIKAVQ